MNAPMLCSIVRRKGDGFHLLYPHVPRDIAETVMLKNGWVKAREVSHQAFTMSGLLVNVVRIIVN